MELELTSLEPQANTCSSHRYCSSVCFQVMEAIFHLTVTYSGINRSFRGLGVCKNMMSTSKQRKTRR